ncbi:hypothetical protein BDB00DRAFT_955055 [Zychaea mexicana]|uniref:uncharacterized protein n=1 Tax=Zychaea mexicana TaxID=64656 RepID=UPI0022FE4DE1|nr:uncharacterized protein BDB00DRAFT_955055 [Zychaea mexicana]KAI9494941.1 hypothetical protein BDB00DRAFT_955055 [Zychaea mexicana]
MLFDRYRKGSGAAAKHQQQHNTNSNNNNNNNSSRPEPQKTTSSSLASAFFRALTRRAWHQPAPQQQQRQDFGVVDIVPRHSASLPNIARYSTTTTTSSSVVVVAAAAANEPRFRPPVLLFSNHDRPISKRHSAGQALIKDAKKKKKRRHSFTYGHQPVGVKVSIMPRRSVSHQQHHKRKQVPRGDSNSSISTSTSTTSSSTGGARRNNSSTAAAAAAALSADQLAAMLREKTQDVTLIDVRHLFDYQKRRIDGSLNVNLPSLLIKRYQRGTVSNFNLENFITTAEGRARYRAGAKPRQWVVYDDDMVDQTSQAWTLVNVLDRIGDVYYLEGGFKAFQSDELLVEGFDDDEPQEHEETQPEPLVQLPRRSLSYTMGAGVDKSHLHRRTSLFSLDTQAARANNASALARRANKRSLLLEQHQQDHLHQQLQQQQLLLPQQQHNQQHLDLLVAPSATTSTSSSLTRVVEDEDDDDEDDDDDTAGGISPQTEADFEFIISEIIPGFLFVGPEIETIEQAEQLEARKIRRVLNMAEECNDDVLQKDILYRKIAARDTVEMKNIDWVMMEAVCFIEDAKRHHEPIYVHCKAGKSRSVTAILAYLVCSERWTLKQAYRHVIKARPNMSPNIGFIAELMKMEGRVHGRVSSFMETDWQSTSLPSPEFTRELKQLERAWQQTPRDSVPSVALR